MNDTAETNKRVFFLKSSNASEKIEKLQTSIQRHFIKKERILIYVNNPSIAQFVDELLWKYPPSSFLPHAINCPKSNVCISDQAKNINQANILINLDAQCPPLSKGFNLIYDIYDLSSPKKLQLAQEREQSYLKMGYQNSFL